MLDSETAVAEQYRGRFGPEDPGWKTTRS